MLFVDEPVFEYRKLFEKDKELLPLSDEDDMVDVVYLDHEFKQCGLGRGVSSRLRPILSVRCVTPIACERANSVSTGHPL